MSAVRLVAVGDISFADNAVTASFGIDSLLHREPGLDMFEHVRVLLRDHDIVFGNLETVLSSSGLQRNSLRSRHMRGRPEAVAQLVDAGFNVVNVANNHILQHGRDAFEDTVACLRSNGILVVGLAGTRGFACEPARTTVRGVDVVFLGYAFEPDKYFRGRPLYAQTGLAGIVADIRRVKTARNVVVCSFHWGREFVTYPSLEQIAVARAATEAGCNLILGHHPHVLNGFERHDTGLIFYSLGNFVFDQLWNAECTKTMAVHVEMSPGGVRFAGADDVRIGADYRPVVADDAGFQQRLATLCAQIGETIADRGAGYARDASRLEASNRYRSWLYLVSHLHRYDMMMLGQILAEAVFRRVRAVRAS